MTLADLEQRVARIERELARLHTSAPERTKKRHPLATLEKIHGTFEDDAAYREAQRLGRKWRKGSTDTRTSRARGFKQR